MRWKAKKHIAPLNLPSKCVAMFTNLFHADLEYHNQAGYRLIVRSMKALS